MFCWIFFKLSISYSSHSYWNFASLVETEIPLLNLQHENIFLQEEITSILGLYSTTSLSPDSPQDTDLPNTKDSASCSSKSSTSDKSTASDSGSTNSKASSDINNKPSDTKESARDYSLAQIVTVGKSYRNLLSRYVSMPKAALPVGKSPYVMLWNTDFWGF